MIEDFIFDMYNALMEEVRALLPRGARFLRYSDSSFQFLKRTRAGNVYLWTVKVDPLEALRKGVTLSQCEKTQVTSETWDPRYGLYGAPDGTYVSYVTYGDSTAPHRDFGDGKTLRSYGIVVDGMYKRLHGTNWAYTRGHYTRWNTPGNKIVVKHQSLHINPKEEIKSYAHGDMYLGVPVSEDMDIAELARKLNEQCVNSILFHKYDPSPDYYDMERWKYTPPGEEGKSGTWSFA